MFLNEDIIERKKIKWEKHFLNQPPGPAYLDLKPGQMVSMVKFGRGEDGEKIMSGNDKRLIKNKKHLTMGDG